MLVRAPLSFALLPLEAATVRFVSCSDLPQLITSPTIAIAMLARIPMAFIVGQRSDGRSAVGATECCVERSAFATWLELVAREDLFACCVHLLQRVFCKLSAPH